MACHSSPRGKASGHEYDASETGRALLNDAIIVRAARAHLQRIFDKADVRNPTLPEKFDPGSLVRQILRESPALIAQQESLRSATGQSTVESQLLAMPPYAFEAPFVQPDRTVGHTGRRMRQAFQHAIRVYALLGEIMAGVVFPRLQPTISGPKLMPEDIASLRAATAIHFLYELRLLPKPR
ncbi:MAG: hypothetical protein M0R03_11315 [Novosphingobium sp.]|nr:hypothetical protein [Novosphingobium sp.]